MEEVKTSSTYRNAGRLTCGKKRRVCKNVVDIGWRFQRLSFADGRQSVRTRSDWADYCVITWRCNNTAMSV